MHASWFFRFRRLCLQKRSVSAHPRAQIKELVAGFERDWRRVGATIARSLRPGLSDPEMDAVTLPLGIRLPEELRGWWGTHDGATLDNGGSRFTFSFAEWLSLTDASQATRIARDVDIEVAAEYEALGLPRLPPSYLIVMRLLGRFVVCDCAHDSVAPVYCLWPEEPWRLREPATTSFAELLEWWQEAFDAGTYEVREGALVRVRPAAANREATGLI